MKHYLVWCPDYDQARSEAKRIPAFHESQAVEAWAEKSDRESAEYAIVSGGETTVMVAEDEEGSEAIAFVVFGEAEPTYYARRKS